MPLLMPRGSLVATRVALCGKGLRAAPEKSFDIALFDRIMLKIFQLKCTKV
jgi:hypothetical protein